MRLADDSVKEDLPCPNLSEGPHSLPPVSREQSNDQSIESTHNPESRDNSATANSDDDLIFVSERYRESRKHAPVDKESPTYSSKRMRPGNHYTGPDEAIAKRINFFKASIQRREQFKAEELVLEWFPVKLTATQKLYSELRIRWRALGNSLAPSQGLRHSERRIQILVNEATDTIRRLLEQESIDQVRALQQESRTPQRCARWPEILHPPLRGNINELMACCEQLAGSNSVFDFFSENLARSELNRAWGTSKLDPATSEGQTERARAIRGGGNLRILADAFGIGILAFIPRYPHTP